MNVQIAKAGSDAGLADAQRFLAALGGDGVSFSFQTFSDKRKNARLARVLHGSLAKHAGELRWRNGRGAGIFVCVNKTDGKGRKAENIKAVRAYFADLDGVPLEPVLAGPLKPHCIIESSPGRWHAYWWISGAPLTEFKRVQQALAQRFGADPAVCDLPRVMRIPGFRHQKAEPFQSRIVELHDFPRYTHADFVAAFGIDTTHPVASKAASSAASAPKKAVHRLPTAIPQGERTTTLLRLAGAFVRKGIVGDELNTRMQRINAERCQPPLDAREVDAIAARAMSYGSAGYVLIPHALLDSPGWRALSPPAQVIGLAAIRRAAGSNEPFALVHPDFAAQPGLRNDGAFCRHRQELVRAGFLRVQVKGRRSQQGVLPSLYIVAPHAMQGSLTAESGASETPRKQVRKLRKVELALAAESGAVVKSTDRSCAGVVDLGHQATKPQPEIAKQNTQTVARLYVLADHRPRRIGDPARYYCAHRLSFASESQP